MVREKTGLARGHWGRICRSSGNIGEKKRKKRGEKKRRRSKREDDACEEGKVSIEKEEKKTSAMTAFYLSLIRRGKKGRRSTQPLVFLQELKGDPRRGKKKRGHSMGVNYLSINDGKRKGKEGFFPRRRPKENPGEKEERITFLSFIGGKGKGS